MYHGSYLQAYKLVRYTKQDREFKNLLPCYLEHMEEHLQSVLNIEESIPELASEANADYLCVMPSTAKQNIASTKMKLAIPDARRAEKRKRTTRVDKRETNSFYKAGDATISKVRKRKGKLSSSVSKSTVATRDTNYISKKDAKRRKHKGRIVFVCVSCTTTRYRLQYLQ